MLSRNGSPKSFGRTAICMLLAAGTYLLCGHPFTSPAYAEQPAAVPGQYLVKFRSAKAQERAALRSRLKVRLLKVLPLTDAQLVEAPSGSEIDQTFAKELLASGQADYIEPNYIVSIDRSPSDPRFSELWGLNNDGSHGGSSNVDIDAPEAWNINTGSSSVVVGVVDTGISYTHPDLAPNMWVNTREVPNNGIDDDHNGVVDDVYGRNAISGTARPGDPLDDNSHGSHTAGTIAAAGSNGVGITGVNWNVKLMALKFLNSSGSGAVSDAITAIGYAVMMKQRGVNVRALNNSWGGGSFSTAMQNAISSANSAGIVFVAAAGNSSNDNDLRPSYPASYDVPNVISVAAVDSNGNLASFSNYGASEVDLAAPGVNILSTVTGNSYASYSGTSMATPHVTGVAALLASNEPALTPAQIRSRLMSTVKPLSTLNGVVAAPGIVSAYNALANSTAPVPETPALIRYTKTQFAASSDPDLGTRILQLDDGYAEVPLNFDFPYYLQNFRRLAVSANGRILPLSSGQAMPTLPANADYSNLVQSGISVYNDDLFPAPVSEGGVWVKQTASAAVVTWVVVHYGDRYSTTATDQVRFQAKLYADGRIEFHYLDTEVQNADYSYGASATVSIAPTSGVSGERLVVSDDTANQALIGSGRALRFRIGGSGSHRLDFDGDGSSDIAVWRPASGMFFILTSGSGFDYARHLSYQLGLPGDQPLSGDYDGDGRADLVVWRPADGTWYFRLSGSSYSSISSIQWGLYGDRPVPGDYDGDGKTDLAVYRAASGAFYVLKSKSGFDRNRALSSSADALTVVSLGGPANDPVVGNFLGGDKDSFTVIWQLVRFWSVKDDTDQLRYSLPWGEPGDTPLACDWNADGTAERVMVRVNGSNTLDWYAVANSGAVYTANFGSLGDKPSCDRDYDGDGTADLSVFRPQSADWFVKPAGSDSVERFQFGLPGDVAL